MKTRGKLYLAPVIVAACSLSIATGVGQLFDAADVIGNQAVAASPRAKEQFPQLTRTPCIRADVSSDSGEARNELTEAIKNGAYAASPRVQELFPELGRAPALPRRFAIAPLEGNHTAILTSPRAREEFPHLLRSSTPGAARDGAPKLIESRK